MLKNTIATLLAAFTWLLVACPAQAGPVADIKSTLTTTRQQTMSMLSEDDRAVLEMRYEDALRSSKDLDTRLTAALKNESLRGAQPTLAQFKTVWEAFKKTRDDEIIPALMSGSRLKARVMALSVQKPRFDKMNELLESLPQ
ncbi:MAG: hypothetical protein PHD37_00710 [Gallionellaceae bacterium]|nr:hypothetical protein [Gallionellaceae bacterium]